MPLTHVVFFTQPDCLSCELTRVFLQAKEIAFEERDISTDLDARRTMTEQHGSGETPTLVIFFGELREVIIGFNPVRLEQLLDAAPFSDSVTEP
jgi:glutaredoxin